MGTFARRSRMEVVVRSGTRWWRSGTLNDRSFPSGTLRFLAPRIGSTVLIINHTEKIARWTTKTMSSVSPIFSSDTQLMTTQRARAPKDHRREPCITRFPRPRPSRRLQDPRCPTYSPPVHLQTQETESPGRQDRSGRAETAEWTVVGFGS